MNNTNNMKTKTYTSLIDLYETTDFLPYTELNDNFVEWINETCMELISKSTFPENLFKKKMFLNNIDFVEQAFFMINGKSYFLDFIMPKYMIAIEIDGSSHIKKEDQDFERDRLFNSIGIKTLRISNSDVYRKDFIQYFLNKVKALYDDNISVYDYYSIPSVNRYQNKMTINQKLLDESINKLKALNNGTSVLLKTNATYLIYSIITQINKDKEIANIEQIKELHTIIKNKNLTVVLNFIGNRRHLHPSLLKIIRESDRYNLTHELDKHIEITFESIKGDRKYSNISKY